jgi:hypothetical protein
MYLSTLLYSYPPSTTCIYINIYKQVYEYNSIKQLKRILNIYFKNCINMLSICNSVNNTNSNNKSESKSKSNLNQRQPILPLTAVNTVITLNNDDTNLNKHK